MGLSRLRKFVGKELVVASHNKGKVREISELLAPFGIDVLPAKALFLSEPEEDGMSFIENARIKAHAAAKTANRPALSDDSGLVVPALGGLPGIHSARWAGPDKDFQLAMERVEHELHGKTDRSAYFVCALVLAWPDGTDAVFEGRVDGTLVWPPRGIKGFGYDPVFQPTGLAQTFGEIEPERKHAMSHRAQAFHKLVAACFS